MKRARNSQVDAPGQDSFLDVVANLVGILIILVMVVGSLAQKGLVAREAARLEAARPAPEADLARAESAAAAVEESITELDRKIQRQNAEAALRQQERDRMQLLVTVAEQRLAEHRDQLTDAERAKYDLEVQLAASRNQLGSLEQMQVSLIKPPPSVIQHLPTPMAKTVFGAEVHFRLLSGRLTYVPWDEMIDRLKADAPNHVHKLRSAPRAELSLPVVGGFGARYVLRRADEQGQSRVELEKIYFVDAEDNLGTPLAEALQPTSAFKSRIAAQNPQRTTVTVWVYPDSFDEFRQLKAELFKMGYLCAARPLPAGHPIGGSPDGSRSSAE